MELENMKSPNGKQVPNQFEVTTERGKWYRSYESNIVLVDNDGQVWLDKQYWDYSPTTSKYRNMFLGNVDGRYVDTKICKQLIRERVYKLTDLN